MMVELVSVTPRAEEIMAYCARVSSPQNQDNHETAPKLLAYCIRHAHWSVFEMADMTMEIQTSRAISAQILRHRSFSFQEFSQRYATVTEFETYTARRQDLKNRQNSTDDLPAHTRKAFLASQLLVQDLAQREYDRAIASGVAKECARFLLPMSTATRLYMKGSVRSWVHYLQARDAEGVQKEHRGIAQLAKGIFTREFPPVSSALGWAP